MQIKKTMVKRFAYGLAGVTLITGGLYTGYYFSQQNVVAEQTSNSEASDSMDRLVSQATMANILETVFTKLQEAKNSQTKLSQDALDGYAFYLLRYYESGRTFYGTGQIGTPEDGLELLAELYQLSGIEPAYTKVDGSDVEYTLVRELHKPEHFDDVVKQAEEQVENKLEKNSKDDTTSNDITVQVDGSKLVEGD